MKDVPPEIRPQDSALPATPRQPRSTSGAGQTALQDGTTVLQLLTADTRDVLFRIRLDPPHGFDYVSPSVEAMTGHPPEDFYRDPELGFRIVHPDDRPAAMDPLTASHEGVVVRWVHRDGRILHVEPRAVVVRDESGRPLAVQGIVRDVSARVHAEEALRESEARLRSVFAAMAEGVLVFDEQGRAVEWNASAERILGTSPGRLLGSNGRAWWILREDGQPLPPAEYPSVLTLRTGRPTRDRVLGFPQPDQTVRWFSVSSEPLRRAGEEQLRGVLVSFADMTAERRAWIEVRRREAQLQLAMECAGHDFWELDLGRGELTRGGMIPLPGPSKITDIREWRALVHPDDQERALAELDDHVAGRTPAYVSEYRLPEPDGSCRWILNKGRAVMRDEKGLATRLAGTITDITVIKRLQERLRNADRLAGVGTLAAGVAHEINNPLAYVMGNLTLLDESLAQLAETLGDHPDQARRVIEMRRGLGDAMDGAERVRGIVQGLRQFAEPSRGEERESVDLKTEIEAAIGIARNEIAHRARLQVDVPADLPAVRAAPRELGQVLVNLLVNAARSIPEGRAQEHEIRIAARAEGDRVVVEVRDTGAGIAPADLPHVFDPFFTTEATRSGMGLGLSVCHGIVTSLGGTIEAESTPGHGSTFRVRLPTQPPPAQPAAAPAQAPAVAAPARRGRVLVIDDEALVARSLARLLSAHEVTMLTSAAEALERATAGERWDVVLCDLMMPEMTGMELEERLAKEAPDLLSHMVYLTGGAFTERSRAFLAAGRPHLEKPVEPAVLRARVAERMAALLGK